MMRRLSKPSLAALAILGSLAAAPGTVRAGDGSPAGVIRISDNKLAPIPEPNTLPMPVSNQRVITTGYGGYVGGWQGGCNGGGCDGGCGTGCRHKRYGCFRLFKTMLCPWGGCTHSPDHGWCRPQKIPVERIPVVYRRYWPAKWYGQPGYGMGQGAPAYPTVYMPTDTTQLGFYYQGVPQWQPNPGMLPPVPHPSNWHIRCSGRGCGYQGHVINGGVIQGGTVITPEPDSSLDKNGVPPQPKTIEKTPPGKSASNPYRGTVRN